jgi:hypothetical protein
MDTPVAEGLEPRHYEDAIMVQDACNLSGVVHSFSKVLPRIWVEARAKGEGTKFVNEHPISVLFSSKIASLTGSEVDTMFSSAYAACMEASHQ